MNEISTALPTHLECIVAIDGLISAFADSRHLEEQLIETATIGIAKGIQIRDYALGVIGLSLSNSLDSLAFINALQLLGTNSASLEALKSAYAYEEGDLALANECLDKAIKFEPNHSLSALLRRVYSAQWSASKLVSMREELHPKVKKGLLKLSGVIVGEESE